MTLAIASASIRTHARPVASIASTRSLSGVSSACQLRDFKGAAGARLRSSTRPLPSAYNRLHIAAVSSTASGEHDSRLTGMPDASLIRDATAVSSSTATLRGRSFCRTSVGISAFFSPFPQALQFPKRRQAACPQRYLLQPCLALPR